MIDLLPFSIVLGTSIWVLIDSRNIGIKQKHQMSSVRGGNGRWSNSWSSCGMASSGPSPWAHSFSPSGRDVRTHPPPARPPLVGGSRHPAQASRPSFSLRLDTVARFQPQSHTVSSHRITVHPDPKWPRFPATTASGRLASACWSLHWAVGPDTTPGAQVFGRFHAHSLPGELTLVCAHTPFF